MYRLPETAPGSASGTAFPWRTAAFAITVFATLAVLVALGPAGALERVDAAISIAVRAVPSPALDTLALAATLFGDFPYTVTMMALVVALLFAGGHRALALHAAWLFVLTKLAVAATKLALARARPLALYEGGDSYAFPSGHATSAAVLLGVIGALFLARRTTTAHARARPPDPAIAGALAVAALLVGLSRVRLGAHWPSDIVGGFALATVLLLPFAWQAGRTSISPRLPPLALATLVVGYAVYAGIAWHDESARYAAPSAELRAGDASQAAAVGRKPSATPLLHQR